MKQFLALMLAFAGLLTATVAQISKEDIMAKMKTFMEQCKQEFPISDAEVAGMMQRIVPSSQVGKCFVGCMSEKCGVVKDGMFSVEGATKKAQMFFGTDPDKMSAASAAIEKCSAEVTTTDKCETGPRTMQCFINTMPELSVPSA